MLPPVLAPEKVVCVGMNYRDHCLEQNAPIPKEPIIFSKFSSCITGPYDNITLPDESQVKEGRKREIDKLEKLGGEERRARKRIKTHNYFTVKLCSVSYSGRCSRNKRLEEAYICIKRGFPQIWAHRGAGTRREINTFLLHF